MSASLVEPPRRGQVVALLANFCWVELDLPGPAGQQRLLCTRRTRLAKSGQAIRVGAWVRLEGIDWAAGRAVVAALEPSQRVLDRPPVANITRVVVVVALAEPDLDPLQLTRFLITAEQSGAAVELVLSKADLGAPALVQHWLQRAASWGYAALAVSSRQPASLEELRRRLIQPGLSVLCGPSGVGKSSLINALIPDLELRVAAVSGRLLRGRHTTRHVELFALADGALLADTPGFNRPQLPADPTALMACFPELRPGLVGQRCQFGDCLHQDEPGCAVGTDWDRHGLYSQCLQELLATAQRAGSTAPASSAGELRQRGNRLEPRLAAQYRRTSRRGQRQQADAELNHPDQEG